MPAANASSPVAAAYSSEGGASEVWLQLDDWGPELLPEALPQIWSELPPEARAEEHQAPATLPAARAAGTHWASAATAAAAAAGVPDLVLAVSEENEEELVCFNSPPADYTEISAAHVFRPSKPSVPSAVATAAMPPQEPPAEQLSLLEILGSAVASVEASNEEGALQQATNSKVAAAVDTSYDIRNGTLHRRLGCANDKRLAAQLGTGSPHFEAVPRGGTRLTTSAKPVEVPTRPVSKANGSPGPELGVGRGSLAMLRQAYVSKDACIDGTAADEAEFKVSPKESPEAAHLNSSVVGIVAEKEIDLGNEPYAQEGDDALQDEWNQVYARTEEMKKVQPAPGKVTDLYDLASAPLSYREVDQWLQQMPVDADVLQSIEDDEVTDTRCGCVSRRRSRASIPGLHSRWTQDKNRVLFLKLTDFDFNDTLHFRMLRTMYTKLTRNKLCPSIGAHWEVMGFQGGDPRTDLNRCGGVLNVLHMFFFFVRHFELLKSAFLLAQDHDQNFPLFCVSINITRLVVDSLLAGHLSQLCNENEHGVFDTTCKLYSAGLYHFYWQWRSQKRTIRDTEVTFKEVAALLERRPKLLLEGLEKGADGQRAKSDPSRLVFTDMSFGTARGGEKKGAPAGGATTAIPARLRRYQDSAEN